MPEDSLPPEPSNGAVHKLDASLLGMMKVMCAEQLADAELNYEQARLRMVDAARHLESTRASYQTICDSFAE